jgi:hypothetical protein
MPEANPPRLAHELAFASFGVRIGVGADEPEPLARISALRPPYSVPIDLGDAEHHLSIVHHDSEGYDVHYDAREGNWIPISEQRSFLATRIDLELAIATIESYMHGITALNAPSHLFIQGGVVAVRGRALVLPALGLTGRTTLVAALVRAGADYYSDEYAVVGADGLIHPYETLMIPWVSEPRKPPPVPVGAVVVTKYRPGALWDPKVLSQGEIVVQLLSHAVPGRYEGERSMDAIKRALQSRAVGFVGDRGDAAAVTNALIAVSELHEAHT